MIDVDNELEVGGIGKIEKFIFLIVYKNLMMIIDREEVWGQSDISSQSRSPENSEGKG